MAIGGNNQTLSVTIGADMDPSGVLSAVKQMQSAFSGLKLPGNIGADLEKSFGKATDLLKKYQTQLSKGINTKTDAKNITKTGSQINEVLDEIVTHINSINGQQIFLKADVSGLNTLKTNIEDARTAWKNAIQEFRKGSDIEKVLNEIAEKTTRSNLTQGSISSAKTLFDKGDLEGYRNALDDIYNRLKNLKDTTIKNVVENLGLQDAGSKVANLDQIKKRLEDISKIDFSGDSNVDTKFKAITTAVTEYETEVKRASQAGQNAFNNINVNKTVKDTRALVDATDQYKNSVMSAKDQVQQLQQSTQYFFSLRNMINLLKRGVSEAIQTVKELDAAMTETAVVTDFSVGDMWEKLPEYTANANKLGATIQDMYESTTLYYQQGLNTQQSMAIATETMKMARIAGLEAKDATDMMTAALRGFNMELNEASATRINDVYSNLAAKTASDTEEIGKAMQRTASIAHSAGMSFEGTAAFLAQAVETTREPAENIGTAMKTIVARFQEMKKNPLEITEVDGEEVSYNKVDAALQSIGVSLKDANGQFRELDKVFLDISKKWDGLSQTQQRYIATIAAGSRQQSRFIAMMGDYDRTVELMSYANDSAGASQEQFNKTLDSLAAKINKFQNAWDQFLMGIMNDSATKFVVDAGTKILDIVNKIINVLSFNGELGLVKSLLSIGTAFTALKAGGNIVNKLIGGLGGLVDPTSSFGKGFWGAGKTTAQGTPATGVAGKITTPIVAKLNELIAVTKGNKEGQIKTSSTIDQYKATNQALRKINGMDMGTIGALFSGLSDEHAYMAYKNAPGTTDAMKQAALGWLGSKKMPADAQKVGQQLMSAIFKGMDKKEISIKDGMKLIGQPQKWGEKFGTDVAWNFSNSFSKGLTQQANQLALKNLGFTSEQAAGLEVGSDALKAWLVPKSKFAEDYAKEFIKARELLTTESLNEVPVTQTNLQKLANNVGLVGSKFSTAGMSLQMFGAQLGQLSPALEGVGALLGRVGMTISTFGMGISGLGTIVTKGAAAIKAGTALAVSSMAATPGVIGAGAAAGKGFITGMASSLGMSTGLLGGIIGAVIIGAIALVKGHLDKKAKEAGEEVRENFEKGFTETNKKIDSIEGYKDRFNELSKGVDQFGHNISLTDEEYDEYLSISRDLQELSPSLIAGYNAEGQAILRKGEAIDEVINKLKEERDLSLADYIDNDSIDKLIKAYNTSDVYKKHHTTIKDTSSQNTVVSAFNTEKSSISKAIKAADLEWSDFSQILDELGIGGADSIDQLTSRQLSLISAHYTDILNKIKEFNPQIENEAEEGLKEAFAKTNNAIEDVLTEGAPVIESLRQWMGQENLDAIGLGLGEEFVNGFNSGIEGLMLEGLTNSWKPEEYKKELKDYADEWKYLAGPTSQYADTLADADKIQQEYLDHIGEDGAIDNYKNNIETTAQKLEQLAAQYKDTGTAGEVFAEQCQRQANNLRNYATEGVLTLGEALNTLSDEFTSARGAQERFQKATEDGDYYTAAEGYKSIIDTMFDEKNVAGGGSDGSLAFWAGADELLGQQFVDSHTSDEIVKQVEKIKGCFEDGLPGIQQFGDLLVENADKLKGLGEINEKTGQFEFNFKNLDDLEKYAELLGISEDALAALIDKSRQYVSWNLSDPGAVRKAIEDSQYSMAGVSTRGENLVYTSESQFRAEARQQGIRGDDYTKTKSDAEERGVRFLNVENLTAKKGDGLYADQVLENIGLKGQDKTIENAVAAFTKMGLDLEDTKQVLMSDGIKLADSEGATAENIEKAYNEQVYEMENPTVAEIANDANTLVSNTSAMLAAMGILTEDAKKNIENNTSNDTIKGYTDLLNKDYTNTSDREAARAQVQAKRDEYQETIDLYAKGGLTEDNNEYIAKLVKARNQLDEALAAEATSWQNKISEYSQLFSNIGNDFVNEHAIDFANAFSIEDINQSAEALRQLEEEGKLTHAEMRTLAAEFMQVNQASLQNLDSSQLDALCTKLGLTKTEATGLLDALEEPFVLEGRLEGENLEAYIKNFEGLDQTEKTIFLRTDVSGEKKVEILIDKINKEFGDSDEKKKSVIIEATAEMANGNQEEAEKILSDAGFSEEEVKTITQKLSIIVNGSVANPDQVKAALQSELNGLELTADAKVNVNAKIGKKISKIGTSVDVNTKPIDDAKTKADKTKGTIQVDANTDKANQKIASLKNVGSTTLTVNAQKGTGWTQTMSVIVKEHDAHGRNYSVPAHRSLSFGSAAKGMNIPKPKKTNGSRITALVGEEGFEVGYIPSEQRSVIFGANGPEMTSFPSDTIIYPHSQSKQIIHRGKRKHQTANSFEYGNTGSSGGIPTSKGSSNKNNTIVKNKNNQNDKDAKKNNQDAKKNNKEATKVIKKAGNVNAWWWNMGKKVEATQRLIDKTFKKIEKLTNTVGTSLASISEEGDFYIKKLNKQISLNTTMMDKAQKQLNTLDKGAGSKKKKSVKAAQNRVDRAEAKVKKAQKNHDKKAEKRAKKELKKAKKNLRKKQNTANYSTISYDVTVQKKDKKGKVTKTKKNKKQRMDLSPYVKLDEETGAYVVDYKKINSKNWDKSKKKAVMEAAEKKAETYQKRRDTAEDNIEKAQEALDELGKNLYETFLSWEIELTRIWNISQKIAESEARRERAESFSELLEVQLGNGVERILNADGSINQEYLDKITNTFEKGVQEQVNTITLTQESIGIKANELYKSLSTTGEQTTLGNVQKLVENAKFTNDFLADAEKQLNKASTAAQKVVNAKEDKAEAKEDKKEAKDEKKKAGKTKTKKDDKKAQNKINEAQKAIDKANDIIDKQSQIAAEAQTAAEDYQRQAEFYIQQNNGRTYTDTEILAYEREIKDLEDQIKIKNAALEFTDVTPNTDGTVTIDFHTEEFEKARQEGRFTAADAEKIQAYVQKLVDDSKDIQETYKTLTDQLTTLNTTLTELQEAWAGYADDLLSYLEEKQSKDITKLKTLSDSIKDSLSKLLDQVKKTLQERRNQEDNAKTEQDILRKQQRLASLRANTSGGNQVEIAQLEREINEAQTSYGRTLEDQLLDRLSNQADEAAEQREKQIKIQEGIRDTVNNAATVNKWMSSPAMFKDSIRQAFFSAQDWENMPLAKQEAIEKSFQTFYAGLLTNQKKQTTIADAIQTTSSMVEFIEDSLGGNVGKDITDDTANTDSLDTTVREIAADINSNINRSQNVITQQVTNTANETNTHTDEQFDKQQAIDDYRNQKVIAINDKAISATELKSLIKKGTAAEMTESDIVSDLAGTDELTWKEIIQAAKDAQFSSSQVLGWFQDSWPANRKNYFNNAYNTIYKPKTKRKTTYKTGGLADFTGPAWLDGTPSKPELVLNAKDTQNFIALKNILNKAISSAGSITNSYGGDATYEININVDHLSNDYDVDRVAERVKKIIVKDSSYRNVTQVRNFR